DERQGASSRQSRRRTRLLDATAGVGVKSREQGQSGRMKIKPGGGVLGARVEGIDLRRPLSDAEFRQILRALGEHGGLCLPAQQLEPDALVRFGRMFGEL